MKNIHLITFIMMIPIVGCSKKRSNPQPLVQQEVVEKEKPVDLDACTPESQTEACKQLTQKIDQQNDQNKRELEILKNELNAIKEASANDVIKFTEEKAALTTEISAITASMDQQKRLANELENLTLELKKKGDELEELKTQAPTADDNGQHEKLVSTATDELLKVQKAVMDSYVSLSRQQLLNFERSKKIEEKLDANAEKVEFFKTRIAELQIEIDEVQNAAKSNDSASIKTLIDKIVVRLPEIMESLNKSQEEQRIEIAKLEGSLTQKSKDLEDATKKLGDSSTLNQEMQDKINALNERITSIFKDQYLTLDSLESAMTPYVRVAAGSIDPTTLPKKIEELSGSLDSQKPQVDTCRQQALSASCTKLSQQYYFTLRQKRFLLVQQERNKILPSGNLSVLGPEAKQNLKGLWDSYVKTSGMVVDVRAGKKITDKELADLKSYFSS
jgi:chromosome segregation ATPase